MIKPDDDDEDPLMLQSENIKQGICEEFLMFPMSLGYDFLKGTLQAASLVVALQFSDLITEIIGMYEKSMEARIAGIFILLSITVVLGIIVKLAMVKKRGYRRYIKGRFSPEQKRKTFYN